MLRCPGANANSPPSGLYASCHLGLDLRSAPQMQQCLQAMQLEEEPRVPPMQSSKQNSKKPHSPAAAEGVALHMFSAVSWPCRSAVSCLLEYLCKLWSPPGSLTSRPSDRSKRGFSLTALARCGSASTIRRTRGCKEGSSLGACKT